MAVAHDAVSTANGAGVTSLTWSHTCSGADRCLAVGVAFWVAGESVSTITYAGDSLSIIGKRTNGASTAEQWRRLAPATGSNSIVVTPATAADISAGGESMTGVDQTTPTGIQASAVGTSTAPSVLVTDVGFDASSTLAVGTGDRNFTHTPVGTPKGVLVLIVHEEGTDQVVGVTYGGTAMTEVTGSPVLHTTPETGSVHGFFLGSSVPTGAQTVAIDVADATDYCAACFTVTADGNTEIHDTTTFDQDGVANPSGVLTISVPCFVAGALYSGAAGVANTAPGSGTVDVIEGDLGADTSSITRGDSIKTADFTYGWTVAADDSAGLLVAIRKVSGGVAADELVLDTMCTDWDPDADTLTVGSGQTQRWNVDQTARPGLGGSTEPGAALGVTMSWTITNSREWVTLGTAFKPAVAATNQPYYVRTGGVPGMKIGRPGSDFAGRSW